MFENQQKCFAENEEVITDLEFWSAHYQQ